MDKTVILSVGGDNRMVYACEELSRVWKVYSYASCGKSGDTIILSETAAFMSLLHKVISTLTV